MNKSIKVIGAILSVFVIILGVGLLSDIFVYGISRVEGIDKAGSLTNGDYVLVDHLSTNLGNFKRFDLVIIQTANEEDTSIKRIIGMPGEKIEYIQNKLYVNGEAVNEPFTSDAVRTSYFSTLKFFQDNGGKIPENQYFVVNDNRSDLLDSRTYGTIETNNIQGVLRFRVYPFNKIGKIS